MANPKYPEYRTEGGEKVPSVTTILGRFKESGGLLYWANKVGREGLTLDEARKPAADAGTIAHAFVEAHIFAKDVPTFPGVARDVTDKAEECFQSFLRWQKQSALVFEYVEVPLVSEVHRFGGRIDGVGRTHNELVLADFKTSNSVYIDYLLQMAAYAILWEENYPELPLIGGFHLLRFAKEEGDFAHHHYPKLDREKAAFLLMRKLFDEVKAIEKRVK